MNNDLDKFAKEVSESDYQLAMALILIVKAISKQPNFDKDHFQAQVRETLTKLEAQPGKGTIKLILESVIDN